MRMGRLRLHGLRCLAYALLVLALLPCIVEFGFRVAALRAEGQAAVDHAGWQVLPSASIHHQLAPLQRVCGTATGVSEAFSFQTNSLGLRGPEIAVPKPAETLRIVCLGDETILAANLPDEAFFGVRLAAHLQPYTQRKIEVINAGVPESCPLLAYLQVKHQLLALQPDLLIIHFDPSDVSDDARFRTLTDLDTQDAPLVCVHPLLVSTPKIKPLCQHFLCVQWVKKELIHRFGIRDESDVSEPVTLSKRDWRRDRSFSDSDEVAAALKPVEQLARLTSSVGCRTVLAVHPLVEQLLADALADSSSSEDEASSRTAQVHALNDFEKTSAATVCRISHTLRRVKDPQAAFEDDYRTLSKFGHDIYAYALAETMFQAMPEAWTTPDSAAPQTSQEGASRQASHAESSASRRSHIQRPSTAAESPAGSGSDRY